MTSEAKAAALERWAERFRQAAADCRAGREVKFVVTSEDYSAVQDMPIIVPGDAEVSEFLKSLADEDFESGEAPPRNVLHGTSDALPGQARRPMF